MSEVEILTPQRPDDAVEGRNEALAAHLGISLLDYSQLVEDAVFHATQNRPWAISTDDHQTWVPVGPRNVAGRVTALAQDPANRLVLYAGTAHGGLWQTCDAGDTWEHLGEEEQNAPVSAIAIHAHDRSTLLIGTGLPVPQHASGRGLYRVTVPPPSRQGLPRNAAQFTQLAPAPPPSLSPADVARTESLHGASMRYTRIRFDPYEKERFWAASQTGLWRWEPRPSSGAARFVLEFPPESIASGDSIPPLPSAVVAGDSYAPYATDVLVARDPRSEDRFPPGSRIPRHLVIYVAVHGEGVYRGRFDRSDRVMRWERRLGVPGFLQSFGRIQLALCERRPQRVYALMDDGKDLPTAVYRSDDNGEHWRTTGHPFSAGDNQAFYDLVLEVSPSNPDMIYAGVVDGYLSRDGGGTWRQVLDWTHYDRRGDYAQHADQHAAVFDRFERGKLWIGNDGGLACSRDLQTRLIPRYSWRVRSHGIAAGQFQDISFDPASPYRRCVGGLQDNGSWLSIGGPTWYRVGWGDGAFCAFDRDDARKFIISHQYAHTRHTIQSADAAGGAIQNPVLHDIPQSIASFNTMAIAATDLATFARPNEEPAPFIPIIAQNPEAPRELIFGWKRSTVSGKLAAYFSRDFGTNIAPLNGLTDAITPDNTETSAACFGPALGNPAKFDGWVGFTNGKLLRTDDAPGGNWFEPASPWPAGVDGQPISRIAVHPADHRIAVISTSGTPGRVFITYDRGGTWQNISERIPTSIEITPATPSVAIGQRRQLTAVAKFADGDPVDVTTSVEWKSADSAKADFSKTAGEKGQLIPKAAGTTDVTATLIVFGNKQEGKTTVTITAGSGSAPALPFASRVFDLRALPPAPIGALAFDPDDPTRLFAGTLAGVYLLPNLPGAAAAGGKPPITIRWQPFHRGLPLTMINDLARVPGTKMLRAATFGRGLWDCDLTGTTRRKHRLLIRQTVIEDGFADVRPAPAALGDDPRLPAGKVALDHAHAFDIRVDSHFHEFFDDRVDGVEFDERLGADKLAPLAANAVYVQIHNVGRESVPNVTVHLYFRESPVPAPIGSAAVQLPADATLGSIDEIYQPPAFEPVGGGSPADGASWTRAGAPRKVEIVAPGTPVVVRFDWKPPAALASKHVALLALCSGPDDAHDALPAAAADGPHIASFIAHERRAALRIVEANALLPDIFIPNGVDDDGHKGSIAPGLRSPHIIVTQEPVSDAAAAFRNPLDLRKHDRLKGGTPNHIFVRVRNRGVFDLRAEVEVWAVKVKADLTPDFAPANWQRLSPAPPANLEIAVAAGASAFAEVTWTPPDPAPSDPAAPAGEPKSYILVALAKTSDDKDPLPDKSDIDSIEKFNKFLARQSASDNVAARAIRWVAP